MDILLATKNINKYKEISNIFKDTGNFHQTVYKKDLIDVKEDKDTILENAKKKAHEIYDYYRVPVVSDDSGLFVNVLNGMPGIRSKRYSGENATDQENIEKLLSNLSQKQDRSGYFKTVLYFYDGKNEITTEGILEGFITKDPRGVNGFGYDSIFEYESKTLAELTSEEKNRISHRKIAANKMIGILNEKI
jgi:XTP/dITP diphosphohydrolase